MAIDIVDKRLVTERVRFVRRWVRERARVQPRILKGAVEALVNMKALNESSD